MPYIKKIDRTKFLLANRLTPQTAGELNYLVTMLVKSYVERMGGNYQAINDTIGALEGAKLEMYRRLAAPYEDLKIDENGDVYE